MGDTLKQLNLIDFLSLVQDVHSTATELLRESLVDLRARQEEWLCNKGQWMQSMKKTT